MIRVKVKPPELRSRADRVYQPYKASTMRWPVQICCASRLNTHTPLFDKRFSLQNAWLT